MNLENSKLAIIGLGYVGLPLAIEFAKHFHTVGFDISENMIPFSRLVNNIIDKLVMEYDGFKILEDGIETIYINKKYTN